MDYFQGVVIEYLRAKRSVFVNTECLLQLDEGTSPQKGRHWYCDIVAVDLAERAVYLCEVTYSATLQSIAERLQAWRLNWPALLAAIRRDSHIPTDWSVCPWVFLPEKYEGKFLTKFQTMKAADHNESAMPRPRITHLEATLPWEYLITWDRKTDALAGGA